MHPGVPLQETIGDGSSWGQSISHSRPALLPFFGGGFPY